MFHGRILPTALAVLCSLGALQAATSGNYTRLDTRPVVTELVTHLQEELGRKVLDEEHAKELVEKLASEFAISGTRDRTTIVKVLERCLAAKQAGKPDAQLVCHAARALAAMAPESLPILTRALDQKPLLKDKDIGRTLVLALGKTRDKSAAKELLAFLDHPDEVLVAASGEALGEYESAELATRKQLFEEVLKALMQAKDQKESQTQQSLDPNSPHDDAAARRYDAIQAALGTTLQRLSKQDARDADLWQRWWNKNKRANWDDKTKLASA